MGVWLCSQGKCNRTGGKGLWLCYGGFRFGTWENFPDSVVRPWHRLPRTVLESPSLEGFKNCVDLASGDMFWWWAQQCCENSWAQRAFPTLLIL